MSTAKKYAPGDRVVGTGILYGRKAGAIVKSAKLSARVRWDSSSKEERVDLQHLVPETAEHVATRQRAAVVKAWRLSCPKTTVARVEYDRRWGCADELGAELRQCRTPAEMRPAPAELRLLADWFEKRPKGTP